MKPGASPQQVKALNPNWLDLPRDVTIQIFTKLGVIDLLCSAQSVCSSWRAIARYPQLYRIIDMREPWNYFSFVHSNYSVDKMAIEAIDRSCGQLIEFSMAPDCSEVVLDYLKYKSPPLKCLRVTTRCTVDDDCVLQLVPKLPLLEEVQFCINYFSKEVIEVSGRSCPNLKSFRLNDKCEIFSPRKDLEQFNEEAFAIAGNMIPSLQSLHLLGNLMNNDGLEAILNRFSQLEYLDLRQCFNIDLKGDLLKRCERIKTLRLPNDSTEDYEYEFAGELSTDYGDDDSDYDDDDE